MYNYNFINQGWECPKCKRVYSPTTSMCLHCPQSTVTTTVLSTGTSTTRLCIAFTADPSNSSNTKCANCGLEKHQHPIISYT